MSEEGVEAVALAQDQNQGFFTGNIMNFKRPKFHSCQENRLEALKAFKKKCGYIFKGSVVNISNERKCILVQDWLGPEGQKIYDSLDWFEGEDVNNYDLMWTKLERAVSPECNEIVASKKFKERLQKPGETITAFVTDLLLLVKDCNYVDEDRQVRDQFVYGVSDGELKKRLLEKGDTLTRFEAIKIGKAYESTKIEVQECSANRTSEKESIKAVSKDNPRKSSCVITVQTRRELVAFQTRNSAPSGEQSAENARPKITFKTQMRVNAYKKENRRNTQIQNNQNQPQNYLY